MPIAHPPTMTTQRAAQQSDPEPFDVPTTASLGGVPLGDISPQVKSKIRDAREKAETSGDAPETAIEEQYFDETRTAKPAGISAIVKDALGLPPRSTKNKNTTMPVKQPPTLPTDMPESKKSRPINEAIAEEVRKDQGETPTFPFGEREFEERAGLREAIEGTPPQRDPPETENEPDITLSEARAAAELERVPGGSAPTAEPRDIQNGVRPPARNVKDEPPSRF